MYADHYTRKAVYSKPKYLAIKHHSNLPIKTPKQTITMIYNTPKKITTGPHNGAVTHNQGQVMYPVSLSTRNTRNNRVINDGPTTLTSCLFDIFFFPTLGVTQGFKTLIIKVGGVGIEPTSISFQEIFNHVVPTTFSRS